MSDPAWAPEYAAIAGLVRARAGLTLTLRWQSTEAGIRRAMARAGLRDPHRYRALLEGDASAFDDLVIELTIGETYFFREPAHFAFIRDELVPALRQRRDDRQVRSWSAGCASGEEAYSLAMTFAGAGVGAHVLATDISLAALRLARAATYTTWSLRGDGAAARPYLHETDAGYVVVPAIRAMVTVEQLNLALDVYPSFANRIWGLDLILCRNVLIYLDRDTVRGIARRLCAALAPGGWLLTGASDPPLTADGLETVVTAGGVVYRRAERIPSAASAPKASARTPAPVAPLPDPLPPPPSPATEEIRDSARAIRALANSDITLAERRCADANAHHPASAELRHLWGLLLVELGRDDEAAREVRRALYLDRSLAVVHFTLGAILHRQGDEDGARRSYRQARTLCARRPPDEPVPLGDGEPCGRLALAAETHIALLGETEAVA